MDITWLGHSGFRLKSKEATVIIDPPQFEGKPGTLEADLVTVSHAHEGHANLASIKGDDYLVFRRPGEYESKDVLVTGVSTFHDTERGEKLGKNTVFVIEMESMTVCHLGDLGVGLTTEQTEALGRVDILLIPVGGVTTINATKAVETINSLEPKVVIPMHYREDDNTRADLDPLEKFLGEMGVKDLVPQQRITLTRSTLPTETQIMLMEVRRG